MRKYAFLILILFSSCNSPNRSPEEIISELVDFYNSKSSIYYKVEFKNKNLFKTDTAFLKAECIQIRNLEDTLMNGCFWFKTHEGIEKFYDLHDIFSFEHQNKKAKKYDKPLNLSMVSGNINANVLNSFFIKPDPLLAYIRDTTNRISIKTVSLNNSECCIITIDFPDSGEIKEMQINLWINQPQKQLIKYNYKVFYQGNYQYQEWVFKNITFNKYNKRYLDNKLNTRIKNFNFIEPVHKSSNKEKHLEIGTRAPLFEGIHFQEGEDFNIRKFEGKLLLLDFWYMACFPCIKAIPHLNEISKKYDKDDLIVLGLNSKDDVSKKKDLLEKFIKHNNISYPIISIEKTVDSIYCVNAYPTIYLLDKKRKIVFTQIGYNPEALDSLDGIINNLIDK